MGSFDGSDFDAMCAGGGAWEWELAAGGRGFRRRNQRREAGMAWIKWIGTREKSGAGNQWGEGDMTGMRKDSLGWEGNDGADASMCGAKWRDQGSY